MRRLAKFLFVALGLVAILLAVGLGVIRLLIAQIPDYQTELKAFVAEELGLDVDFSMLDARLGLRGPELSLRDASIGGSDGVRFLLADEAALTLDPVALAFGRRIEISRLTLAGVELTLTRDAGGRLRIGDFHFEPGQGELAASIPEAVELVIRDSVLRYVDAAAGQSWEFNDLFLRVEATSDGLDAAATLRPPAALAARIELGLEAELDADEPGGARWHARATAEGLDLAGLARLAPIAGMPEIAGNGSVDARVEWIGTTLAAVALDLDLEAFRIGGQDLGAFERIGMNAEWQRQDAARWRLDVGDLMVTRGGRSWAPAAKASFALETDDQGIGALSFAADFIRLEDLAPFVTAFPETQFADQWELFEPVGDIRALDFTFGRRGDGFVYRLDSEFSELAVRQVGSTPGIAGVSGSVHAIEDSGTIDFASGPLSLDWPLLFPRTLEADSLAGAVVWRQGRDVVQVLSVDLGVGILDGVARGSFDLRLPRDGSSPVLDIDARLAEVDLVRAKAYLPTRIMPTTVANWLEQAVAGGTGRNAELEFYGPVASFPFDDGLGQFRVEADVEDASLNYMQGWPVAEGLDGRISFVNAGFFARGSGRVLTNVAESTEVAIPDMRIPLLTLAVSTDGPLAGVVDYLRSSPLIAEHLGPDFARIRVESGTGAVNAAVSLPLDNLGAYDLDADLRIVDGEVAIEGLRAPIHEIRGVIRADETAVTASEVEAVFLGGPIVASLARSEQPGYRAVLSVEGETTAEAAADSFQLPHLGLLAGQTLWRGELRLPSLDPLATMPAQITIESNLAGVGLRFPAPLAKPPSEPVNLRVDFRFAAGNRLEVSGNLGASRRFELDFVTGDQGLRFSHGAVQFGGDEPRLPIQEGLLVGGQIESVALDAWIALAGSTGLGSAGNMFLGADVAINDFHAFGQQLGMTDLRIQRSTDAWQISLESEAIAGEISVPREAPPRSPIVADMRRIYLAGGGDGDAGEIPAEGGLADSDPRELPGVRLDADEFGIGTRRLGSVHAVIEPDPRGLVLTEFTSRTGSFESELSGSWLQGPLGSRTTIDARIRSTDVEAALTELGIDPVIEAEMADVQASVYWDAAPSAAWLDHIHGGVSLFAETGSLREVDPGAGRVLGLMSIAALPRRLLLDFRDVFEEGFAFDEIRGDFRVIDGNAYTNNLKFDGPAAEIGVVGRTGLRDRDYRQQIVVTAQPGNMLPTVGGLLGGAGIGVALFVFTRLFKEPLKGIGRASYCLTGSWDAPTIEPIEDDESGEALRCVELPAEMLEGISDE